MIYRVYKFFVRPSVAQCRLCLGAKKHGKNSPDTKVIPVKNKQNSSVNFLVRAKLLIWRRRRLRPQNVKHYKHLDSIGDD